MHEILLVEDDVSVREALTYALSDRGFAVEQLGTAVEALRAVTERPPDLVLLDLGLPDLDGGAALRMLRGVSDVPVIVATARGDEGTVVDMLDAGADDYVVKPFSIEQLVARIYALLRRTKPDPDDGAYVLEVGGLRIDVAQRVATLDGRDLDLNRREFDLLAYLAARPNSVVSRRDLLQDVWRERQVADDQTIDVHVSWLRRKLGESAARPRYLHTVRGVGLKLSAPA